MALNNPGSADTQHVVVTANSTINNVTAGTFLVWIKPTTLNASVRRIAVKNVGAGGKILAIHNNTGIIRGFLSRATTSTDYRTSSNLTTTGAWNCIAMTWDHAAGAGEILNIYRGTLTAPLSEGTYGTQTDGSGGFSDDSASNLWIGATGTGTSNFGQDGDYALFAMLDVKLSLAQCIDLQFNPRRIANCVVFHDYGFSGTTTQVDWSGRGNSGAISNLTVAAHVPLRPAFGADLHGRRSVAAAATFNAAWNAAANSVFQPGAMAA